MIVERGSWSVTLAVATSLGLAGVPMAAIAAPDEGEVEVEVEVDAEAPEGEGEPVGGGEGEVSEGALPTEGLVLDEEEAARQNAAAAFHEGSDLFETGKYREAIERFQRAWELSKEVQLLFNIGQAYWKWYDVDPDVDHLRQGAVFFRNYDKRMRLTEGYDPTEIDNILTAIGAQIEVHERKEAEANRPVIVQPGGPTEEELAWQQRRRTTKGLVISGTAVTVLGGLTLATGVAGLLSRVTFKVILDNSTAGDGGINLASADEDARRRNGFLVSGQVAFGSLIAAAVVLPLGIGLRVAGAVREKKDRAKARERDQERERNAQKAKVAIEPTLGGLRIRF